MDAKTLKDAQADLERLIDNAVENHEPTIIVREGKPAAVIVSLEDWNRHDATEQLMRGKNGERLRESIAQIERGEVIVKTLEELEALAKQAPGSVE